MSEYFVISLIGEKTSSSKSTRAYLSELGLFEGKNRVEILGGRKAIISFIEDDEADFEELSIGISELSFHEDKFEEELKEFTSFINRCFELNSNFVYALCSYELNGYLIGDINNLQEFDDDNLLRRFPLVYQRKKPHNIPTFQLNLDAQEIFV